MKRKVIVTTPYWSLNGVNAFSADLAEGLQKKGAQVTLLLTAPDAFKRTPMPPPRGVQMETLPVAAGASLKERREALRGYLENQGPCFYLPNYDYSLSCIAPQLSPKVRVVGIIHSDDPEHYEHARRLGPSWDAVVSITETISRKMEKENPRLMSRSRIIPYGVLPSAEKTRRKDFTPGPLRIIYAGRMADYQKRVFDLPYIAGFLGELGVPCEWTLAGDGIDRKALEKKFHKIQARAAKIRFVGTLDRQELRQIFQRQDIFILTSSFEGLPIALLEAMSEGCIPVVSKTGSGIPDLIQPGENGFFVPVGDRNGFAERIKALFDSPQKREALSSQARKTAAKYGREKMVEEYEKLFDDLDLRAVQNRGQTGRVLPPPLLPADPARIPSLFKIAALHLRKRVRDQWQQSLQKSP